MSRMFTVAIAISVALAIWSYFKANESKKQFDKTQADSAESIERLAEIESMRSELAKFVHKNQKTKLSEEFVQLATDANVVLSTPEFGRLKIGGDDSNDSIVFSSPAIKVAQAELAPLLRFLAALENMSPKVVVSSIRGRSIQIGGSTKDSTESWNASFELNLLHTPDFYGETNSR